MSVADAVKRFNQLARLCPELVPTDRERIRRLMRMFKIDNALVVDIGGQAPKDVEDCIKGATKAEFRIARDKEEREKNFQDIEGKESFS